MDDRQYLREQISKLDRPDKKNFEIRLKKSRRRLFVMKTTHNDQTVYALAEVIKKNGAITHRTAYDFYTDKEKLITEMITRTFQIIRGVKDGKNQAKRSTMYAV